MAFLMLSTIPSIQTLKLVIIVVKNYIAFLCSLLPFFKEKAYI